MDYAAQQRNPAKHLVGIGLVVLLHIVLIYALVNGLAMKVMKVVQGPIETKIIQQVKPPPETPPPPPPKLEQPPPPYIPPPEVNITQTAPPQNTITVVTHEKHPPPPPPRPPPPNRPVALSLSAGDEQSILAAVQKYLTYPPRAVANNEEGTAMIRVTFKAGGAILRVDVVRRSGYFALDAEARKAFERMGRLPRLANLPPGAEFTVDIPVTFKLSD
ncbi:MAG: TonB family protein [Gammaproteobacteria bacterium]|nr:TonB family protein [Gammaproteobacteria bacterium]